MDELPRLDSLRLYRLISIRIALCFGYKLWEIKRNVICRPHRQLRRLLVMAKEIAEAFARKSERECAGGRVAESTWAKHVLNHIIARTENRIIRSSNLPMLRVAEQSLIGLTAQPAHTYARIQLSKFNLADALRAISFRHTQYGQRVCEHCHDKRQSEWQLPQNCTNVLGWTSISTK